MKKLALFFPMGAIMAAAVWAFAAGDAGDPLASLSYLTQDFTRTVERNVDKALDTSDEELLTRLENGTARMRPPLGRRSVLRSAIPFRVLPAPMCCRWLEA